MTTTEKYTCTECEHPAARLYYTYPGSGNLKIERCCRCANPVDKYVEYDIAICLLDLLLLQRPVWRHTLFNRDLRQLPWKLSVICTFCEGYRKWMTTAATTTTASGDNIVFHAAKQVELYLLSLLAALELLLVVLIVLGLAGAWRRQTSARTVVQGLLLANGGKLFFIPALVWAPQPELYLRMVVAYVVVCSALALSLTVRCRIHVAMVIVGVANAVSAQLLAPLCAWSRSFNINSL